MTVWRRAAFGPSGAPPRAPCACLGGGGGGSLGLGGGTGPTSPSPASIPQAGRGESGRGGGRAGASCCPPSASWFIILAAAGAGLKAQAQASATAGFPCAPGGSLVSPGPRSHCLGGAPSLALLDARVAGGWCAAECARPPCTTCSADAVRRPRVPGAGAGGLAAGGSVLAVMPAPVPCGRPAGGGTGGWAPALGVRACPGSSPGRWTGLYSRPPSEVRPTGRQAVVLAFAHGLPATWVAAAAPCGTVGGGWGVAGASGGGPGPRSVVSVQRVRVPGAAGARHSPACPRPPPSP